MGLHSGNSNVRLFSLAGKNIQVAPAGLVFHPEAVGTFLGHSTARWGSLWSVTGDFSGALTVATTLSVGGAVTLTGQTTTTSATAGGATALPATPTGYLSLSLNGATVKVPYYT